MRNIVHNQSEIVRELIASEGTANKSSKRRVIEFDHRADESEIYEFLYVNHTSRYLDSIMTESGKCRSKPCSQLKSSSWLSLCLGAVGQLCSVIVSTVMKPSHFNLNPWLGRLVFQLL